MKKFDIVKNFLKKIIAIILPNRCLSCNKFIAESEFFCEIHKNQLEFTNNSQDKNIYFDSLEAIFFYNKLISEIIFNLKYYDQSHLKRKIGELMAKNLEGKIADFDLIIPVPLHKKRLKERKFNQSALLCKEIIKFHKNLKFYPNLLLRTKYNKPQARLSQKERQQNLTNSFIVNKKYENFIKDKKILIIDDVFTTGTTLQNCCEALKNAGCKEIKAAVIAKTKFD